METIGIAVGLVALAAIAFILSVHLGMLLGRRLDRALEARPLADGEGDLEENRGE